ncbi:hypothetical protein HYPSUDRAFT_1039269 [Hypholoma sublateritium FD-334 SS-4]|uniref:Secreted protein n=1 Tax=Hypholoma sublateritium (strain FD-334 SS-4) TaxID=945553 RepID=A0A0D2LH59_HYPSF|nr:hypothetical protein HYPSUDRAFT_1039269 [Hypholoma sublateritium FD-334 SS-4]
MWHVQVWRRVFCLCSCFALPCLLPTSSLPYPSILIYIISQTPYKATIFYLPPLTLSPPLIAFSLKLA